MAVALRMSSGDHGGRSGIDRTTVADADGRGRPRRRHDRVDGGGAAERRAGARSDHGTEHDHDGRRAAPATRPTRPRRPPSPSRRATRPRRRPRPPDGAGPDGTGPDGTGSTTATPPSAGPATPAAPAAPAGSPVTAAAAGLTLDAGHRPGGRHRRVRHGHRAATRPRGPAGPVPEQRRVGRSTATWTTTTYVQVDPPARRRSSSGSTRCCAPTMDGGLGETDCRVAGACVLAVAEDETAIVAQAPLPFAPDGPLAPPPVMSVSPADMVGHNQAVTVTASGLVWSSNAAVVQCAAAPSPGYNDCDPYVADWVPVADDGTVTASFTVSAVISTATRHRRLPRAGGMRARRRPEPVAQPGPPGAGTALGSTRPPRWSPPPCRSRPTPTWSRARSSPPPGSGFTRVGLPVRVRGPRAHLRRLPVGRCLRGRRRDGHVHRPGRAAGVRPDRGRHGRLPHERAPVPPRRDRRRPEPAAHRPCRAALRPGRAGGPRAGHHGRAPTPIFRTRPRSRSPARTSGPSTTSGPGSACARWATPAAATSRPRWTSRRDNDGTISVEVSVAATFTTASDETVDCRVAPGCEVVAQIGYQGRQTSAPLAFAPPAGPGERYLDPVFDEVEVTSGVVYRRTTDAAGAGVDLALDVYEPPATPSSSGRWSCGCRAAGSRPATGPSMAAYAEAFARRGYVAVTMDYRHRPGLRCCPTDDVEGVTAAISDATDDAAAGVAWLRDHAGDYRIDPEAIAVGGHQGGAAARSAWPTCPGRWAARRLDRRRRAAHRRGRPRPARPRASPRSSPSTAPATTPRPCTCRPRRARAPGPGHAVRCRRLRDRIRQHARRRTRARHRPALVAISWPRWCSTRWATSSGPGRPRRPGPGPTHRRGRVRTGRRTRVGAPGAARPPCRRRRPSSSRGWRWSPPPSRPAGRCPAPVRGWRSSPPWPSGSAWSAWPACWPAGATADRRRATPAACASPSERRWPSWRSPRPGSWPPTGWTPPRRPARATGAATIDHDRRRRRRPRRRPRRGHRRHRPRRRPRRRGPRRGRGRPRPRHPRDGRARRRRPPQRRRGPRRRRPPATATGHDRDRYHDDGHVPSGAPAGAGHGHGGGATHPTDPADPSHPHPTTPGEPPHPHPTTPGPTHPHPTTPGPTHPHPTTPGPTHPHPTDPTVPVPDPGSTPTGRPSRSPTPRR